MKPYYADDRVVLYHADCRDVLPTLGRFDLLLTDPPYGIDAANYKRANTQHGASVAKCKDYGLSNWDKRPPSADIFDQLFRASENQIIFGANHFISRMPHDSSCWLVWDKENGDNAYADCELAWTSFPKAVRIFRYRWQGMLQGCMGTKKEQREHPTQKPLPLMLWCLENYSEKGQTILDPFAGSGTTGRAAKDLGRNCVLIEREEKYCEIAAKRMQQEVLW